MPGGYSPWIEKYVSYLTDVFKPMELNALALVLLPLPEPCCLLDQTDV